MSQRGKKTPRSYKLNLDRHQAVKAAEHTRGRVRQCAGKELWTEPDSPQKVFGTNGRKLPAGGHVVLVLQSGNAPMTEGG